MIYALLLAFVVSLKVFKKSSPNGRLTVYLGKRDFADYVEACDVIDGVVIVEDDYLKGRKVFGQVVTTYRYGREQDEVMGLKFSRDLYLASGQLVPTFKSINTTDLQERLKRKFGSTCYPFIFELPKNAPASVTLKSGENDIDKSKPIGVEYMVKIFVAEDEEERAHKRSTVSLAVRKIQCAPPNHVLRQPSTVVNKGFTFSAGKLQLEVTLDKDMYHHGESILVNMGITNLSKKTVRHVKVSVLQCVEVTVAGAQYSRNVESICSREGCPVTPGASLSKTMEIVPHSDQKKAKRGTALDGRIKQEDTSLSSSTLISGGTMNTEGTGILVSYFIRIQLFLGSLVGDIDAELPFKLVHPTPDAPRAPPLDRIKKRAALSKLGMSTDFVFEDFARRQNSEEL